MRKIDRATIEKLLATSRDPSVTIYLPTHLAATPPNMSEDQLRFKNLYHQALEWLENRDKHDPFNKFFAEHSQALLEDSQFWVEMSKSMLILARPDETYEYFHLPIDSEEYVAVDQNFHLAPVLALLDDMQPYYVLTVTQQDPVVLAGDRYDLAPTDIKLPVSIREALHLDEAHIKSLQFYSTTGVADGANFHGHGGAKDITAELRLKYFRMIDEQLHNTLDSSRPLILAGTAAEVAEYRKLSRYPHIMAGFIHGDHQERDRPQLHAKAQAILQQELVEADHLQALERFTELQGRNPDRVADSIPSIKAAADRGRVDTLLVNLSRLTSDTVRDNQHPVARLTFPGKPSAAAINQIARQVWRQGGRIVNLLDARMPARQAALAVLRY